MNKPCHGIEAAEPRRPQRGAAVGLSTCLGDCPFRAEADHRIANHLSLVASYVRLKGATLQGPDGVDPSAVRQFVQSLEAQIHAVARVHRMLALQNDADEVELTQALHEICASLEDRSGRDVEIVEDFDVACQVDPASVFSIGQFVGEAVINALKYAFARSGRGVVTVSAKALASGAVCVGVSDNGCGLAPDVSPMRNGGVGFRLMRGIARSLGANLGFRSDVRGLAVTLTLERRAMRDAGPKAGAGATGAGRRERP